MLFFFILYIFPACFFLHTKKARGRFAWRNAKKTNIFFWPQAGSSAKSEYSLLLVAKNVRQGTGRRPHRWRLPLVATYPKRKRCQGRRSPGRRDESKAETAERTLDISLKRRISFLGAKRDRRRFYLFFMIINKNKKKRVSIGCPAPGVGGNAELKLSQSFGCANKFGTLRVTE
jgi:hypothetical protein